MALKEHTRKDLELKFSNVHALIKKNGPISDITWLNQLDRAKGHHIVKPMTIWLQRLVLWNLFPSEREKLIDILSEINFFSLTMDDSTDDSVTKQETIFIRNCVQGKTITRFVCIGEPQSTSSEDMFAFVNEKLNENYLTNPVIGKDFY